MKEIITYQPDGFFLFLAALKFFNVAKAMLKNFNAAKRKNNLIISGTLLVTSSLVPKT